MSEKMLTLEEWEERLEFSNDWVDMFNAARQGMIPADEPLVIDLRKVEWPDWANHIMVFFESNTGMTCQTIKTITRPIPAWQPKEGEWVWRVEYKTHSLIRWSKGAEGTFFAKPINYVTESDWTREQFMARGDAWKVE